MTPSSDIIPREVKDIQLSDMKGIWHQLVRITKMRLRIVSLSETGDCFGRGMEMCRFFSCTSMPWCSTSQVAGAPNPELDLFSGIAIAGYSDLGRND